MRQAVSSVRPAIQMSDRHDVIAEDCSSVVVNFYGVVGPRAREHRDVDVRTLPVQDLARDLDVAGVQFTGEHARLQFNHALGANNACSSDAGRFQLHIDRGVAVDDIVAPAAGDDVVAVAAEDDVAGSEG